MGWGKMIVRDATVNVIKVQASSTIAEVARIMERNRTGSVIVEDNDEVVGVLTERDILNKVVAIGENPTIKLASDLMNSPVITIDADSDISEASKLMDERRFRRLIVKDKGEIIGKITTNSISRNLKYFLAKKITERRGDYGRSEVK